jgi:2,3-bisphosphoglycerate-independent phosphoglycerate mutase
MTSDLKKLVCLTILDGWGIAPPGPGNAISQANTININRFWASYPHTQLQAAGNAVGLPPGEDGNTETGHVNLGAGRIVFQDLERINMAIADGSFFENPALLGAINHANQYNSKLHFIGLIGSGGVHSNIEHLYALIQLCRRHNFNRVYLHLFTDGRDSPPTSSQNYISQLRQVLQKEGLGQIASLMGRYWAMDRDRRWDRTAKAYFALTKAVGKLVKTPEEAIESSHSRGVTDEFIEPSIMVDREGKPITIISNNDSVVFFNFRIDRPRQLTAAFLIKDFSENSLALDFDPFLDKYEKTHLLSKVKTYQKVFERGTALENIYFVTMTEYSKSLTNAGANVALPPERIELPIGRVIAEAGLRQLRMSESEKERFVTYYFNGQREDPFVGEDRLIVPSPPVATYDLKPEMSARELTDKLLAKLKDNQDYSFVLINFANPDMVAHTGSIGPTVRACEVVDECIGKIANYILAFGGTLIITADHGNAEDLIDTQTGQIDTEHSANQVPFIAVSQEFLGKSESLPGGILADIAPTCLSQLDLSIPACMTGKNLLEGIIKNE